MQRREPDASGSLALDMFLYLKSGLLVLSLSPPHLDISGLSEDRSERRFRDDVVLGRGMLLRLLDVFALPITVKSGSPSRILCFK